MHVHISRHRSRRAGRVFVAAFSLCAAACIGTPEEFQNTGVIQFNNETAVGFIDVRVAVCGTASFGENRMTGIAETPPGREFRLRISPGCWDALIGFFGGAVPFQNIQVRENQTTTVRVDRLPAL